MRKKAIVVFLLFALSLIVISGPVEATTLRTQRAPIPSPSSPSLTPPNVGVNYLSLYHLYDTNKEVLDRDFTRFKNDGINTIVLVLFWYRLESQQGIYNQAFIKDVIRVGKIANNHGIKVMIDFHTLVGDEGRWSNPQYVGVAMNLIRDPQIANAYVGMVRWAVSQLKTLPNIWAYSVLNEPWYWPLEDVTQNKYIDLIVKTTQVVKAFDGRPVTVRFVGDLFERDWNWDSRLLSALDFVSLNAYVDEKAQYEIYWRTFDQYKNNLASLSSKSDKLGKKIAITEFGYEVDDNNLQADRYQKYIEIFRTTSNIIGWISWGWDAGYDPKNPTFAAIGGYSIDDRTTGSPRPAYYVLAQRR